jgi:tRNA pseudouridine38-40 synthase
MREPASLLPGTHSFPPFAKSGQPDRGDRSIVYEAEWAPWKGLGLAFRISARRYLHHMVRYLVGTMVDIGRGRRPVDELTLLLRGDGKKGEGLRTSPPAPPQGLFLARVDYPEPDESFEIPAHTREGSTTDA